MIRTKEFNLYANQKKLVRFTQWLKDNYGGKEIKKYHKLAQRKLTKYQNGNFHNEVGDYPYSKQAIQHLLKITDSSGGKILTYNTIRRNIASNKRELL